MPTVQVSPDASELLQDVANRLAKSRKVVVITGAGISTNSGIPDFRSEHGLYSLIQAQFDKANTSTSERDNNSTDSEDTERPTKRRKLSISGDANDYGHMTSAKKGHSTNPIQTLLDGQGPGQQREATVASCGTATETRDRATHSATSNNPTSHRSTRSRSSLLRRPSLPRHSTTSSTQSGAEDSTFSQPETSAASSQTDEIDGPLSSSPLSSPPAVFSDPYGSTESPDSSSPSDSESCDESDSEGTQSSAGLFASQASTSKLRNLKGRDLFDSNIWSDPVKTSVFYRFATTLRQKVKDVQPTSTHHFIAQLRDNGKLARLYTQNIDEIEKKIGLSTDLRSGAGNRRRKPVKQATANEQDKENTDSPDQPNGEDDPGGKDASQSSQRPDDDDQAKSRSSVGPAKGVECVFLHGSLHALRCFVCGRLCDWDEDGRETRTMMGEQPECPHCAGATAARQERGKRALGVGKLRPDIVLYGEEHPSSDLISPIVQHDLSAGPDLLLVLGTSLRVHGLKVMVKEFAKSVHTKGGKVVFINFTKPSESTWGDVIDYWIEWDCDAWVEDLRLRKPTLWMSPEETLEYEKQKREDLAAEKERKKESLAAEKAAEKEKKRESLAAEKHKKRESLAAEKEKKRESLAVEKVKKREARAADREKRRESTEHRRRELEERRENTAKRRRETIQITNHLDDNAESRQHGFEPKNPQYGRNDYGCGAYTMHVIAEALQNIRGERYNFFGYTPPAKPQTSSPGRVVQPKPKRPRKSAPAAFFAAPGEVLDHDDTPRAKPSKRSHLEKRLHETPQLTRWSPSPAPPQSYPNASKAQYRKAALELRNSATPPPQRMSELYTAYGSIRDIQKQWISKLPPGPRDEEVSMVTDGPLPVLPSPVKLEELPGDAPATIGAAVKTNPRVRKPKLIDGEPVNIRGPTRTRTRAAAQVPVMPVEQEEDVILPKLPPMLNLNSDSGPRLEIMEPVPDVSPLKTLSPNQRYFGLGHWHHPLRVSNPLAHWQTSSRASSERDLLPSPSDQLREETEAAEVAATSAENFTGYVTPFSDLSEA
ncbi:Hercynylcysteine S-oxide lyase [Apiospora phragmitis]|uniref:Hercynylcysteine S-oxide lyase n=1 Tax=Apiospora phragmitis TaxID=2905665 RepID=A0ABR1T8C4_9PEZI